MWQQAAPENGPRIMQVYRATVSINLEKGRVCSSRALQSNYAGRSTKLELQDHVETQGPLILRGVLIERLTVVQRSVVANFRPDQ